MLSRSSPVQPASSQGTCCKIQDRGVFGHCFCHRRRAKVGHRAWVNRRFNDQWFENHWKVKQTYLNNYWTWSDIKQMCYTYGSQKFCERYRVAARPNQGLIHKQFWQSFIIWRSPKNFASATAWPLGQIKGWFTNNFGNPLLFEGLPKNLRALPRGR